MLARRGSSTSSASTSNLNPDLGHCAHGQCDWMKPDVLEAEGRQVRDAQGANDEGASDVITAGKEPQRKYLTEPPTGYRKATATVKATQAGPAVIQKHPANP